MPPRERPTRTRSSSALLDDAAEAGQAPSVDLSDVKSLLQLLVKAAARQQGIATAAVDIADVQAELESALAEEEEEEEEVDVDEDGNDDDEGNGKGMEEVRRSAVLW
jgi:hypothetical protein